MQVVILCGGAGTRLAEETKIRPKDRSTTRRTTRSLAPPTPRCLGDHPRVSLRRSTSRGRRPSSTSRLRRWSARARRPDRDVLNERPRHRAERDRAARADRACPRSRCALPRGPHRADHARRAGRAKGGDASVVLVSAVELVRIGWLVRRDAGRARAERGNLPRTSQGSPSDLSLRVVVAGRRPLDLTHT